MKTKIIVYVSWAVAVAFFCVTTMLENEYLNTDFLQVLSSFLALVASFVGYKILPEPVKIFLKKLIMFIFSFKKRKKDDDINHC